MRKMFIEFLRASNIIPAGRLEDLHRLIRTVPEPIGAIAFSYGMISGGDIDVVLEQQRKNHRPFGELAMSMGMLTLEQVNTLLRVQEMRGAIEVAQALALSGICAVDEMMLQLGRFFSQRHASVGCTRC